MGDVTALFDAVLTGLLESFTPAIDQIFTECELRISSKKYSDHQLDEILQKILISFPRNHHHYPKIIETLTSFAESNPEAVLTSLCAKFKIETSRQNDDTPSIITISSLTFAGTLFHHFQFVRYLSLIILTDLMLSIFRKYPCKGPISKLVQCGSNLCVSVHRLTQLQNLLISTWSIIFLHISYLSLKEISMACQQYVDDSNSSSALFYKLISRVQGTPAFADSMLMALHQSLKKKLLTSEILSSVATLVSHIDCEPDVLNEFFTLAWNNKNTNGLKDGAIDLITTLFPRLVQHQKKIAPFYSARVYKHAHEDKKVERSAVAFLRLIRGDVAGVDVGEGQDSLCYIRCNGSQSKNQQTPDSFASTFMKIFFPKSNFAICPSVFCDILVHLASLDILFFIKNILPHFMQLPATDPRFMVILKSIIQINNREFIDNAFCEPTIEQINNINKSVREVVLGYIPLLEEAIKKQNYVLIQDSYHLQESLDEADHLVNDFLSSNNYIIFEPSNNPPNFHIQPGNPNSIVLHILRSLTNIFTVNDMKNPQLIYLILNLTVNEDQLISSTALDIHTNAFRTPQVESAFIDVAVETIISTNIRELRARCIQLLLDAITRPSLQYSPEQFQKIEEAAYMSLCADLPHCRLTGIRILSNLANCGLSQSFMMIKENSEIISDAVNRSILVLNVPEKPSLITPPMGSISFMVSCASRYNEFWLLYFAEIVNILIEGGFNYLLMSLRKETEKKILSIYDNIDKNVTTDFNLAALLLLHIDSYAAEENSEEEEYTCESESFESKHSPVPIFEKFLESKSLKAKRLLLHAFCFLNWRIIPSLLPSIMSINNDLYPDAAASISFIIQNPDNFNHIISKIFRPFIDFLSILQSFFIKVQINSQRDIKWDEKHYQLLHQHEGICVNYCILISAAFNNIQDQIPEEEWPVSYRQILVQFLIHWAQLPSQFVKIKSYALNALIPIIHAGTVFTNGFQFEMPILEMLVSCQANGYPVLDSLLLFHLDILLDEFVKQTFIRNRRESQLFLEAILTVLDYCENAGDMQSHVGSLVLLALSCGNEKLDHGKYILCKLAQLFLDKGDTTQASDQIEKEPNMDCALTFFQFATEQVIEAAFDIIRTCPKVTVVKSLVTLLTPWFEKIRLLPTHSFIVQNVPSKFRKFTVITFIDAMFSISKTLDDEKYDVFTTLWFELLKSSDNGVVVLLCLFEYEDAKIKGRIFAQLLDTDPGMIAKYLTKRCSFAYWYFMRTQLHQNIKSFDWMLKVLTRAFIDYVDYAAPNFTTAIHFSLLFIEDAQELFETLMAVFGIEIVDTVSVWTPDSLTDQMRAYGYVSELANTLAEDRPEAIEKWSNEATRWAVACCDIKIAYRSLVILNALQGPVAPSFVQLLSDAVVYHLSRASEEDCNDVAKYIGECFEVLYHHIDLADCASFAFRFASSFLQSPTFQSKCLKRAMPIFMVCVDHTVLGSSAKACLVDAFFPFAQSLETDKEAQNKLLEILSLIDAPELYLIAAPFKVRSLPFIDVGKTLEEILSLENLKPSTASKAMRFYSTMAKTASRPLVDSILEISNKLLLKFEKSLDRNSILQIYYLALQKIAAFDSAVSFIQTVSIVNPIIATYPKSDASDVNVKSLDDVRKEISEITEKSGEVVPITTCKDISQLNGMISQVSPPKIYPFASQYEMFIGLKKDISKQRRASKAGPKKWTSTLSLTSGLMSNKSLVMTASLQAAVLSNAKFAPLTPKTVLQTLLDLPGIPIDRDPNEEPEYWKFVVSPAEFINLEDEALEQM